MAGATTTTLAPAIKDFIEGLIPTLDYQGQPLRQLTREVQGRGDSFDYVVHYGGNASTTTFVENDALSAAGNESYATATHSAAGGYCRTVYSVTGHAMDYLKAGGEFAAIQEEAKGALMAHLHYKEDLAVTALEAAIDSGGSYGGLLRSTYKLASYESAVATTALSDYQTWYETQSKVEVVADLSKQIICGTIDMQNELADVSTGVAYHEFPVWQSGKLDAGKLQKGLGYNGVPFVTVPTMTATTVCMFSPENVVRAQFRPVTVELMAKTLDTLVYSITSAETLVVLKPREAGKLT